MSTEYELIARKSFLRVQRGYLYSMINDLKSSNDFKIACQKRIDSINFEIIEINSKIIEERKRKFGFKL